MPDDEVTITLSSNEADRLTLMMGYAMGAAMRNGESTLYYRFMDLANRVHRNNPRWTPYKIPKEYLEKELLWPKD